MVIHVLLVYINCTGVPNSYKINHCNRFVPKAKMLQKNKHPGRIFNFGVPLGCLDGCVDVCVFQTYQSDPKEVGNLSPPSNYILGCRARAAASGAK